MTQLTEHFTLEEFTRSATATQRGIDNTPPADAVENLSALCRNVLEPARISFGAPIIVTSGYRCWELNAAVGGKPTSQHTRGEAADIQVKRGLQRLYKLIKKRGVYDQLLYETNGRSEWIHVSYTQYGNRHQAIDKYQA